MSTVTMLHRGLAMRAEGSDEFTEKQAAAFLAHVERNSKSTEQTEKVSSALRKCDPCVPTSPECDGCDYFTDDIEHDVVAIYDDAGIPSIMHRFRRITNKELFDGSEKINPAFIIGGEIYDEIFISVYENTMINGKPYSLPMTEPVCNITQDEFAEACFSKGEGWHCLTAAEWGLLANTSLKLGTLPHGNTNYGAWHGDASEMGERIDGNPKTFTGSGPKTWTHNHKITGVHDLCGNMFEFCRGLRIKNGALQTAKNNDAALPETDLSENGTGWRPITDDAGCPLFVSVDSGTITITPSEEIEQDYCGCRWADVIIESEGEQLKELALFAGEPDTYCWMDSTEGEYLFARGGRWAGGASYGVFYGDLSYARGDSYADFGGRSAYFKKHGAPIPETQTGER